MSTEDTIVEMAVPAVALVRAVADLVGGPAKMRDILDAEFKAVDIAMDVLEQEKIDAESDP